MATYDPAYLRGIECFNRQEYFESHEVWESLWQRERGPGRRFYQGLIQAAVALHHWIHDNRPGARKLAARSRQNLDPFRPQYLGLDLDAFLVRLEAVCGPAAVPGQPLPRIALVDTIQ